MKEKLEKIVEETKQFVKSKVSMGLLATGLALGYVVGVFGCGEENDCSCYEDSKWIRCYPSETYSDSAYCICEDGNGNRAYPLQLCD